MRAESLSEIIGTLYDCVLEPQHWNDTLPLISAAGESTASSIVVQDRGGGGCVFEHGADQSFLRLYFEKLATSQVATARPLAFDRVGDVATMTMIAGEREAAEQRLLRQMGEAARFSRRHRRVRAEVRPARRLVLAGPFGRAVAL